MRIACSTRSMHREIPQAMTLLQFPAWCGSEGIPGIEVVDHHFPSLDGSYLDEVRRACSHAAVDLVCLAVTNDFTIADPGQHFAQVERVRRLLYDVAVPLEVPVLRVGMGTTDAGPEGRQRALETFRDMVTDLEATGIAMALEYDARAGATPEQTEAIIAGVDSPLFGSCASFCNLPVDARYAALRQLAPLARHVHADSYAFDDAGEEVGTDYKRALATLREFLYDGVISIVYEGRADPYDGVLKTKALIEKHWYGAEAERKAA
ncbi:MAG: sugar phosphate isomerase/epimerase family protein [Armatimonadota bacterium]